MFHYSNSIGLGLDKEAIGHIAPFFGFLAGWLWIVIYQETFGRFVLHRLKIACHRRIAEIDKELKSPAISEERRKKLLKERDDCLEIISEASRHDLRSRLRFSLSG